ncbi:MAG: tyrosine-type recombinase/integrase [Cyanobacteria bacterium J06635_1]
MSLIEQWLHGRPGSTQAAYAGDCLKYFKFVKFLPLPKHELGHLQGYQSMLGAQDLGPRTMQRRLRSLKSLFAFATQQQHIPANIAAALRLPKQSYTLAGRLMRKNDVAKLLMAARDSPRDLALLTLAYFTGARVSEILALKWGDFQTREDESIQVRLYATKNGKYRSVRLPYQVWQVVAQLWDDKEKATGAKADKFVFQGRGGKHLGRTAAHDAIKKASAAAGLSTKISMHWLRHAHAKDSLSAGAPIALVRDTLGHSSIAITNWYLEAEPDQSSSDFLGFG